MFSLFQVLPALFDTSKKEQLKEACGKAFVSTLVTYTILVVLFFVVTIFIGKPSQAIPGFVEGFYIVSYLAWLNVILFIVAPLIVFIKTRDHYAAEVYIIMNFNVLVVLALLLYLA